MLTIQPLIPDGGNGDDGNHFIIIMNKVGLYFDVAYEVLLWRISHNTQKYTLI